MTTANSWGWGVWILRDGLQTMNIAVGKQMNWWCDTATMTANSTYTIVPSGGWSIKSIVDAAYANNAEPVIMWSSDWYAGMPRYNPAYYLDRWIAGDYDAYFTNMAIAMRDDGRIIHWRMWHEMNGTSHVTPDPGYGTNLAAYLYPTSTDRDNGTNAINTPAKYKAAWRHIVDIFRANGATNVKFWFTVADLPSHGWPGHVNEGAVPLADIYPGDAYVDYIGYEFYNTDGGTYINQPAINGIYLECCALSTTKPIIVAEAGLFGADATYAHEWWAQALDPAYVERLYPRTRGILVWQDGGWGFSTTALYNQAITAYQNPAFKNGASVVSGGLPTRTVIT